MSKSRIHMLDELRGLCVVLMVFYHAFYTFGYMFSFTPAKQLMQFFSPVEPLFAGIFIWLCGFSCRLSRNNLKRGGLLAAVAVGMSLFLFLFMRDQMIWFGILHCLAVCILLFTALKKPLDRLSPLVGLVLSAVLFLLTYNVPYYEGRYFGIEPFAWYYPASWMRHEWLMPFGIGYTFASDYFPLLPWVFCFLAGTFVGRWKSKLPAFVKNPHCPPLAFVGRHSLLIYLAHQPVIYAVAWLLSMLLSWTG